MELFNLAGEVAVVIGGSRGIGFSIAEGFAQAGASLIIASSENLNAQTAANTLNSEGLNASAVQADVHDLKSISELASEVMKKYGKIDILVNSAGVIVRKPVEEISEEDWDHVLNINLKGLFFCCQTFGKEMIKKKKGKIINISSDASQIVRSGLSVYSISKAALSHLTKAFAVEWAKHNIQVNAIAPGTTLTGMTKNFLKKNPALYEERKRANPTGRLGEPSDYVGMALLLASKGSDFINGQTYQIDGGSTLW